MKTKKSLWRDSRKLSRDRMISTGRDQGYSKFQTSINNHAFEASEKKYAHCGQMRYLAFPINNTFGKEFDNILPIERDWNSQPKCFEYLRDDEKDVKSDVRRTDVLL